MKKPIVFLLASCMAVLLAAPASAVAGVDETGVRESASGTAYYTYTACLSDDAVTAGGYYVLLVLAGASSPSDFTQDDILYIDQVSAESNGSVFFDGVGSGFVPKNYSGGTAYVSGTGLAAAVEIGKLDCHYETGDVNMDFSVDETDLESLRTHLDGSAELADASMADINGDGTVDIIDLQQLYAHLNGSRPLS